MFNIKEFLLEEEISFSPENRRNYIVLDVCPFCDKKKKFNILVEDDPENKDIKAGFSRCYSCGSGGLVALVAQIKQIEESQAKRIVYNGRRSPDQDEISLSFTRDEYNPLLLSSNQKSQLPDEVIDFWPVPLPKYSVVVNRDDHPEAFSYLVNRGFSPQDIETQKISIIPLTQQELRRSVNNDFSFKTTEEREEGFKNLRPLLNRAIIPVVFNKTNMGYVARDITGTQTTYKVLNSRGPLTTTFCFNYDQVKQSEVLVINEGIFDSVKCGLHRSMALLGKGISPESAKVKLIKRLNPKTVIIYLDNGAYKDAIYLANVLATHFKDIRIVFQKPYLNKPLSSELRKLLQKILLENFDEDEKGVFFHPDHLWGLKEFVKGIENSNNFKNPVPLIDYFQKREKLPVYKERESGRVLVRKMLDRYKMFTPQIREVFYKVLVEVKGLGYLDAGDRTFEENELLIQSAIPFSPGMFLEEVA